MDLFETFTDKMKIKIGKSPEWQARKSNPATDFDALEDF
jgi:hypothetical protein